MDASEFRLNNLVRFFTTDPETGEKVVAYIHVDLSILSAIKHEGFVTHQKVKGAWMRIIPQIYSAIEITEEWLIRFGFEKLKTKMSGCIVYQRGCWRLAVKPDESVYSLWHEKVSPPTWSLANLQYVHHLQNLWIDLNNEELTLNN